MDELQVDRREQDGWTVLRVTGAVDVATAPILRQALTEAQYGGRRFVAVDLDGCEFLDSFGLGVLVGGLKRAGSHDGEVVLICSRQRLLHLFEVTRLVQIVRVAATLADHGPAPLTRPR